LYNAVRLAIALMYAERKMSYCMLPLTQQHTALQRVFSTYKTTSALTESIRAKMFGSGSMESRLVLGDGNTSHISGIAGYPVHLYKKG